MARLRISNEGNELNGQLRKELKGWGRGKAGIATVRKQKAERWEELKWKAERIAQMHREDI